MSQRLEGGGSTLIGTLSQIFSTFYFDASPKSLVFMSVVGGARHVGYCENELFFVDGDKFGKFSEKNFHMLT